MSWDDEGEEEWDLDALALLEANALASRQQHKPPEQQQHTTASAEARPQGPPPAAAGPAAAPQQLNGSAARPPLTAQDLCHRTRHFAKLPPPLLRPMHDRCPGVYGRGCGGTVQLVNLAAVGLSFWACSNVSCAYREYPPPRKLSPELCIVLDRHRGAIEVAAMLGAEDAIRFCGGVAVVLRAAGVDMRRALAVLATVPGPEEASVCPPAAVTASAAPHVQAQAAQATTAAAQVVLGLPAVPPGVPASSSVAATSQSASAAAQEAAPAQPPPAPMAAASASPPSLWPVVFPLSEYERLSSTLVQFGRKSGVTLLPNAGMIPIPTLRAARGAWRVPPPPAEVRALYARMPAFLEAALLPFQREGVLFGLARAGRCLIADEMGVGKTVQAIALASCFQEEWPLLVIVPASLRLVWAEELEKWLPHLRPACIHLVEGKEDRVARGALPLVTITSYEMMQRLTCDACKNRVVQGAGMRAGRRPSCRDLQNCMASQRWKVVIVDESHTLRTSNKPPDALHTEATVTAVKLARRAILLTGTPSLSRPFDLFRQVDAVAPGLLGANRICFASAYCNRREVALTVHNGERTTRWDVGGLSRGGELHDMLKAEVMLRRLKQDVLSQLPPKRRQVIRLPKPAASEWPKLAEGATRHADDSEGSASSASEDEGEEGAEDADGGGQSAKPMSAAHRTGLAKASSVIDWLMTALGARKSQRQQGGTGQKAEDEEDAAGGGDPSRDGCASTSGDSGGPKFLVFAHHKTVMNRLAAALEGAKQYAPVNYVRIDGGTDQEDRRQAVRRFHSDSAVRVALLSVTAAGVGLDFSAASVVVFAELPDEVAHVRQAEDRAHRQGQRHPVNVYFLCAKGTADDRRWQALNRSLARVSAVHDGACLPAATGVGVSAAPPGQPDGEGSSRAQGGAAAVAVAAQAAQAGLVVECVHDAEEAGITPAAAKAGLAAMGSTGGRREIVGGTRIGESPLPGSAAAPAAGARAAMGAAAQVTPSAPAALNQAIAAPGAAVAAGAGVPGTSQCQPATSLAVAGAGGAEVAGIAQPAATAAPAADSLAAPGRRLPSRGCRVATLGTGAAGAALGGLGTALLAAGHPEPAAHAKADKPSQNIEVWFEVSGNTSRVHLHAAPDGTAPLRLSLPMEALLVGDSPPLEELLQAVGQCKKQLLQQNQPQCSAPLSAGQPAACATDDETRQHDAPATAAAGQLEQALVAPNAVVQGAAAVTPVVLQQTQEEQRRPVVVSGIGVLALDSHISAAQLAAMLAEAREFSAEWRELRGLHQSRLHGKILRLPLQEAVEEIEKAAAAAGRLGTSTNRFVLAERGDLALPAGAEWRPVQVAFKRYGTERQYQQPFLPGGARLCINCAKPVPGATAAHPPDTVLDGMTNLFCSGQCEGWFGLKSNGSAYRRALFKLERGVCVSCRLDCHTLVKRLQAVEKGTRGWEEQRLRIINARAPRLMARGYKSYLDQLVKRAVEGNAWQADHIVPVYKGGGLCDVDNLRTLCVACHADVTKQQAKERAAGRKQEKSMAKAGAGASWHDVEEGKEGSGGSGTTKPVVKRRARLKRLICEDSEAEEEQRQQEQAAAAAAPVPTKQPAAAATKQAAAGAGRGAGGAKPMRRKRLRPLLIESSDELELWPEIAAAAPSAAPDAAPAQAHRLARSSTAGKAEAAPPHTLAPAGVAAGLGDAQPLTSGAANSRPAGTVPKKRIHAAAAGEAPPSRKPAKVARRPRVVGKVYIDAEDSDT